MYINRNKKINHAEQKFLRQICATLPKSHDPGPPKKSPSSDVRYYVIP